MGKIVNFNNIEQELRSLKSSGERIILAGGCFDIIHAGHLAFFRAAKALRGQLIILLESDENVRKYKGQDRPIHTQYDRAKILSYIQTVDAIICLPPMDGDHPYFELVKKIEPAIIAVTQHDPVLEKKKEQAKLVGGKIVEVTARIKEYSTSKLIKKIP